MPKSRTALEIMMELILLDLKLLLGAAIAWPHSEKQVYTTLQPDLAIAALLQTGGDDDKHVSSKDERPPSCDPADATNGVAASLALAAAAADAADPVIISLLQTFCSDFSTYCGKF